MFLFRTVFCVGLVVLLLPTDAARQAELAATASQTITRVATMCERNPSLCAAAGEAWSTFLAKAQFGARLAYDLVQGQAASGPEPAPASAKPAAHRPASESARAPSSRRPHGTLTPADLEPSWRGTPRRTAAGSG